MSTVIKAKVVFSKSKEEKKQRRLAWLKRILIYILILIPIDFIYGLIHETGHFLVAKAFGFDICGFEIQFFTWKMGDTYICIETFENTPLWVQILINLSGSLFCLLIGAILFIIAYKYQLHKVLETILAIFGLVLALDFIVYNISDTFFLQTGDWYFKIEIQIIILQFLIPTNHMNQIKQNPVTILKNTNYINNNRCYYE